MNRDITTARKSFAAVRQIERNWRLDRYDGRNSDSTAQTHAYRLRQAHEAVARCDRAVQGLLTVEHDLASRIAQCKDATGWDRPELTTRLRAARKQLRALAN
jgi:hypothetical protein